MISDWPAGISCSFSWKRAVVARRQTVPRAHQRCRLHAGSRPTAEQCLQALALDYHYEVVVVDNAPSGDDTAQLVARFPVRVREQRPGLDWARNCGIGQHVTTSWRSRIRPIASGFGSTPPSPIRRPWP